MIRKILIALAIVGLLAFLSFTAYGSSYKVGDKITLQVMEFIKKTDGDGRTYYDIKQYGIKREIKGILKPVFPTSKPSFSLVLFVKLEKKDITGGKKYFYFKGAEVATAEKDSLTVILKFRRK